MVRPRSTIQGALSFGPEQPGEAPAIAALHRAAAGREDEARLVAELREGGWAFASLVARVADAVVAHVMFSDMHVLVDGARVPAAALGPLAVAEGWRGMGIGGRLVQMGISAAHEHGSYAILVRADSDWYRSFGFDAALLAHLRTPHAPGALMALELVTGALAGQSGEVRYPPPFARLAP